MLFRLKPIYPYRNSENLINPLTNQEKYVALHNILCQIVIDVISSYVYKNLYIKNLSDYFGVFL